MTANDVLDAIAALLAEFSLGEDTPIGLVGHSVGGWIVVDTAIANASGPRFRIRAVVGLAPNISGAGMLDGTHTEAYLLVYGSQDEDVDGISDASPKEAFAAYDRAGTEGSTACISAPCLLASPSSLIERFLFYIHGAGHPGIIGGSLCPGFDWACLPQTDYLSPQDQLCISKGLTNAMMQWKLRDNVRYRRILTGDFEPASFSSIVTEGPGL